MKTPWKSLAAIFLLSVSAAFAADTITGTVHNETTRKPSVGDEVTLYRLGKGMEEQGHTTTDAQGAFTLNLPSTQDQYLLQVSHQGVNYDQPVKGRGAMDVVVYDAVAKVSGLRSPIGIAQLAADEKFLKVTEWYEIDNASNPPVTQSSPENFVMTAPSDAVIEEAQARRGQGMWLKVTADPVKGQSGKYRINFPIRPGTTQFNFVYRVPYSGAARLRLNVPFPVQKFGVMHPASMSFTASTPDVFKSARMNDKLMVEQPDVSPVVGEVPAFEISGTGAAPVHGTEARAAPAPAVTAPPPPPGSVHSAPNPASAVVERSSREVWLLIAGIFVILAIGGYSVWRMKLRPAPVIVSAKAGGNTPLLDALKEQLFQLESDRLHGTISAEEYAASKQALSESIQRAMVRKGSS